MSRTNEQEAMVSSALQHRCPFCRADAGEPCRTRDKAGRTGGREVDWPHSRRVAMTRTDPPRTVTRVKALCCTCGEQRTVSDVYRRSNDPNYHHGPDGTAAGWRLTQSLQCVNCGERTRHAVLQPEDRPNNYDERVQRYVLGGEWQGQYPPDRQRLRDEYFALFPRNPNLKHRFVIKTATEAFDEGGQATALCGVAETISTDPRNWGKYKSKKTKRREEARGGFVVAEQLGDTEYEDPETGLWWLDMDCVDCCRVSNELLMAKYRKRLDWFLLKFAAHPELVPDKDVRALMDYVERIYDESTGAGK